MDISSSNRREIQKKAAVDSQCEKVRKANPCCRSRRAVSAWRESERFWSGAAACLLIFCLPFALQITELRTDDRALLCMCLMLGYTNFKNSNTCQLLPQTKALNTHTHVRWPCLSHSPSGSRHHLRALEVCLINTGYRMGRDPLSLLGGFSKHAMRRLRHGRGAGGGPKY